MDVTPPKIIQIVPLGEHVLALYETGDLALVSYDAKTSAPLIRIFHRVQS